MNRILKVLAVTVLATGCGTRTHKVADVTKPSAIVLTKQPSQGSIHSFSVSGSGEINGTAKISLILNGGPYKTETLSGSVSFQWGGDWYSDHAEIQYTPISVTRGNLKLKYKFND